MATEFTKKISKKFHCEICSIYCAKKCELDRHLNTRKHKSNINGENINMSYGCACGKNYKDRSGLWRHVKQCNYKSCENAAIITPMHEIINDNELFKQFIMDVVKTNSELQKQNQDLHKKMMDMCSINNSNIHSHNKTFNMQIFLNEQCKDAMNIMDFVETFKLEFSDLEKVGEIGYVEGISNIIIKKLNEMDIYTRPIHCSDGKREIMFVKDKNVWEKENSNKDKLRLAIKHITKKNTDMLLPWCHSHPGSCDSDNYLNDLYMQIVQQAMGGGEIEENENKIMRKIAKMVIIDKDRVL